MDRSSSSPRRGESPPQKIARILASETPLKEVREHVRYVAAMKSALWPFLLPSLRSHCELANLRDSTLFFVADSPLWAARLRHTSPQILHAARDRCKIDATRLKVRVEPKPAAGDRKTRRHLSATAREVLRRAAETMNDEDLARRLIDLADRE